MVFLLSVALVLLLFLLLREKAKTRALLTDVSEAIRSHRPYHSLNTPARNADRDLERSFQDALNDLIRSERDRKMSNERHLTQIQATLGAIREAIFVIDHGRTIQFANAFAEDHFGNGIPLAGKRLESLFQGSDLLQFLMDSFAEGAIRRREITIRSQSQDFCLEASSSKMEKTDWVKDGSLLLVMHDITRLKQLERMRKDFVANVSHELRTPLTIIKGYAETLRDDHCFWADESGPRFAEKIVRNTNRLNALVEDLLTLSQLESKSNEVVRERVDLPSFISEVVDNYKERISETEKKIVVDHTSDLGSAVFDRFKIQQVFENLLENVFRHAPDFRILTLGARWDDERTELECRVSDDGPGIPPKDLPHLFERFYRVDKGRSRERGGTGLGLSILKHIVQLHGGRVWAESGLGRGTTFYFNLPQQPAGTPAKEAPARAPDLAGSTAALTSTQ